MGMIAASVGSAVASPSSHGEQAAKDSQAASGVIVLLRNQHSNLAIARGRTSARASANRADQSPLIARAKSAGARNLHSFSSINAFSATVTSAQAATLASDPSVAAVVPDRTLTLGPSQKQAIQNAAKAATVVPDSSVCPSDPSMPLLEPEALQVTNTAFSDASVPQAQSIVDGTGVEVAYIADGIDINNPDFIRADGTHVFVDYQDFSGEGPNAPSGAAEAFGDASAIAAQGRQVYDLSTYVNQAHPLPAGCNITVRGMAPGASLVGLKVFGNSNSAPTSRFIQAIDYAITSGVDVLNESFGGNPYPDNNNDPISLADHAAVAAGITVTASTGDAGTNGTNGSPSTSAGVIGVGATTTFRSYAQTTSSGVQLGNGTWIDNNISGLSSGGVTQQGRVPDLVAPGDLGWALCSTDTDTYEECTNDAGEPSPIQDFGGTSQSAPLTAGAAALVIEAYKNTHGGVRPTPALVQRLLTSTATDEGHPASEQGAGLLNSLAAVQAAESWHDTNGAPAPVGANLAASPTQIALNGNPGASVSTTVSATNVSSQSELVSASVRTLGNQVSSVSGTDTLNTATAPTYVDAYGTVRSYVAQTFTVGANVDQLDVSNAAALASGFSIRIILIDPSGAYAAYSIPQGYNNFSHVDVAAPAAGIWTLYNAASKSSGFNGPVQYNVTQTDFTYPASITPTSMTIGAGKTGTFHVNTKLSSTPGDVSDAIQLTGANGVPTSVPLTLRTDVPTKDSTWTGTITGGNGRAQGGPAQANYYYVNIPKNAAQFSVGFTFADPDQIYNATLAAPDGQVYSFQSNASFDGNGNLQAANGLQIYRRYPQAGKWELALETTNPVSGEELASTFTAKVAYEPLSITAPKFPNGPKMRLASGVPVNFPVNITNTGTTALTYFADGRLNTAGTIPLVELSGYATTSLPVPAGVNPRWLVPSEVTSLTAESVADQPVNLDFYYNSGDPDYYASANGNDATVNFSARMVSPGLWLDDVGQTGPFSGPAPAGTVTTTVTAKGLLFDPAVTSTTGDIWTEGVESANKTRLGPLTARLIDEHGADLTKMRVGLATVPAVRSVKPSDTPPDPTGPVTLAPGQSGTITVTITPSAPSGTVVKGKLFVDDFNNLTDSGDELKSFPYSYTVK